MVYLFHIIFVYVSKTNFKKCRQIGMMEHVISNYADEVLKNGKVNEQRNEKCDSWEKIPITN